MGTNLGPLLSERLGQSSDRWINHDLALLARTNCHKPGIIKSFNPTRGTAVVQIALNDMVRVATVTGQVANSQLIPQTIMPIQDCLVYLWGAGGYTVTLPIQPGDECLLCFWDASIDPWWQLGGVQNPLLGLPTHGISNPCALVGLRSNPNWPTNYSTTNLEIRSNDNTTKISLGASLITITAPTVDVNCTSANVTASGEVQVVAQGELLLKGAPVNVVSTTGQTSIDAKPFLTHQHTGVTTGTGDTGPVL